jgi:hypothetical protein
MAHGALQQDKQQVPDAETSKLNGIAGKGHYSIAALNGVAILEHWYDAVLDASSSIIMIEMPFLRLRAEMGKL